ncbi:hypothetical protein FHX37_1057 [Haloactinospora alba]|uniref:DUF4190 domain-containing protein n=1 Tax=Haloactinospora alba TaxID=405555 RepID=A0A543NH36_9ACTN|nr:hypothetical protein [Haloactinospora alba]TQN31165.1 hypothetical protein FHX37_1057 [Haloactinospora alba]
MTYPNLHYFPRRSGWAVTSFVLGILGVVTTFPLFGLVTLLPAGAALTGAYALRVTHTHQLRGRVLALWGFWLGVVFFLINVGLLMLGIVGMRME